MDWINQAQDCDTGWGRVNTVMKLSHLNCGKFD